MVKVPSVPVFPTKKKDLSIKPRYGMPGRDNDGKTYASLFLPEKQLLVLQLEAVEAA
jgi:hypothetical protein